MFMPRVLHAMISDISFSARSPLCPFFVSSFVSSSFVFPSQFDLPSLFVSAAGGWCSPKQGTVAMEMLEQCAFLDAVVVCILCHSKCFKKKIRWIL